MSEFSAVQVNSFALRRLLLDLPDPAFTACVDDDTGLLPRIPPLTRTGGGAHD